MKRRTATLTGSQRTLLILAYLVTSAALAYLMTPVQRANQLLTENHPTGVAAYGDAIDVEVDEVAWVSEFPEIDDVAERMPDDSLNRYSVEWMGTIWIFHSQEHLDSFIEKPEGYAF
ncbi:MAG: hypothetical protein AB8B64_10745 [Granulosicoccus sp.]